MKKNRKCKHISFGTIIICLLCMTVWLTNKEDRLLEKEILELREKYPICGLSTPANASTQSVTVESQIENGFIDSFVYGEVIGDYTKYYKNIYSGHEVIDDKMKQNGLGVFEFYEYTIAVIEDTEGRYQEGDIITITDNSMRIDFNPKLSDGMKVVVPVMQDKDKLSRNWFGIFGMYYVTEEGYALSAFDENTAATARTTYSGIKVENLLKELAELKK